MAARQDTSAFVETPTDYETHDLDCEHVIEVHIDGVERQAATTIAQQLSLFIETHDPHVLLRLLDALEISVDEPADVAAAVGTPAEDVECWWPLEVEVEDVEREAAEAVVEAFGELADSGFADEDDAKAFLRAVEAATEDQPRSIVRQLPSAGSSRDALEWHTDTDAELGSE